MEAEVSYQEFMSMTIYRMPLRLVEPAAIQQMKDLEAELHLFAAGWILEEEHDPSVAYYLGRDPRLADVLVNARAGAVELIEREIVARLPGAGPDASSPKTGNGIFAICLYPIKLWPICST